MPSKQELLKLVDVCEEAANNIEGRTTMRVRCATGLLFAAHTKAAADRLEKRAERSHRMRPHTVGMIEASIVNGATVTGLPARSAIANSRW